MQVEKTNIYYQKIKNNRCLIPASSYYEHKTISVSGKKPPVKQKHEMFWENKRQFYIAAFYDVYKDGSIGFGLVTTASDPVQAEIHNRMTFHHRDYINYYYKYILLLSCSLLAQISPEISKE